jgi:hypothetical protein
MPAPYHYLLRALCSSSLVLVLALSDGTSGATAKNLNVLINILYAAFVAEQTSVICVTSGNEFSKDDMFVFEAARSYAAMIKSKVQNGLSPSDEVYVLTSAADRAKADSLKAVQMLHSFDLEREPAESYHWCVTAVKQAARDVVTTYIRQPDAIDELIERSKRE